MPSHKENKFLPYSSVEMFDLVAAIDRYPEFLPWCKGARVKERRGDRITADLLIGYKIFQEKFTSVVTLERPNRIVVNYQSGPLSHLSNEWTFTENGKGCAVGFFVDFDFHSPLLSSIMDVFFDRALSKMAGAFEARAEELYG